jgi:hypothetical protein
MCPRRRGYPSDVTIINRIMSAIMTIVSAPFRAIAALFGGRGRRSV